MKQTYLSRRRALRWISAAALTVTAACFTGPTFVVQQYPGPQRPNESIAILRVDSKEPARLLTLDDQDASAPLAEDSRLHIEMLPGRHTVLVGNLKAPAERYMPVGFDAEAGRVYRVVFPAGPTGEARVFEVGRGNDSLIRDVTAEDKPRSTPTHVHPTPPPVPREDAGAPVEDAGLASDGG